ncbi:hypothetical protein BSU04_42310 [Caballeronia sordidicola]|uniref:Uncharacterized protein n=1 Tax=Caballeronia sordidicola TaxID=196367 RepID=A0A226WN63_CABSO|nr:hypothetical protein BSU04_42310 [Caballeronia sordidicola]
MLAKAVSTTGKKRIRCGVRLGRSAHRVKFDVRGFHLTPPPTQ